jgi:uncharacterized protein (TIGR02231 family)
MTLPLETKIAAVAVYTDRVRVTRQGKATLVSGNYQLAIEELPNKLNSDSVRASARGTAQARLLGIQVQRAYFAETPSEEAKQLESKIEALKDSIELNEAQGKLLLQEGTHLDTLAGQTETYALALASGEMSVEAQLALFGNLREQANSLNAKKLELAVQRREMERELEKKQKELKRLQGARPRERYTALVEVEVTGGGDLTIDLTYVVSDAGWEPLYDIRLLDEGDTATLEVGYLAQVTQRTGENWEDVLLSLSTARPTLTGEIPELDPWYIRPRQVFRTGAPAPAPARKAVGVASLAKEAAPELPAVAAAKVRITDAEIVRAEVDTSGAAISYRIPAAASIPPDGEPHKVTVADFPLKPELDYVTAPKLVEAAFRRATVTNDSPYTLLPGKANLFANQEFIGTTKLDLIAPRGEIELYLGVDDRLKVKRELKRREVDKRIISGKRRISYGYEITVENLSNAEVKGLIHDQIPVSKHEEIKVKLDSATPEPDERDELNLLTWEFKLAPKAKQEIRFDFSISYPQEMTPIGLP